ncbi:hypothetical protein GCM10023322_56600 [Rugosimonospora acidiphila]|uniref:HTH araC/xylS-type domain-containing protein n=1 Tax=Rugosimonospora acidiphila TaxID=556531 RepID=A0ABP9SCP3_9ACTN
MFRDEVGLPPIRFERIMRVRRVLDRAPTPARRWARVAAAAGYYDHSHLIAEFRAMMGVTPVAYFADRLPPLRGCDGRLRAS